MEDLDTAEEEGIVMVAVGITAVMVMVLMEEEEEEGIFMVVEDINHVLIMLMAEDITHMLIVVAEDITHMVMAGDIIYMVSKVADMDNNTFCC